MELVRDGSGLLRLIIYVFLYDTEPGKLFRDATIDVK